MPMEAFLNVISPDTGEVILSSRKFYETSLRDRGFTPADGWSKKYENETDQNTEAEKDAENKNGAQRQKNLVRNK